MEGYAAIWKKIVQWRMNKINVKYEYKNEHFCNFSPYRYGSCLANMDGISTRKKK